MQLLLSIAVALALGLLMTRVFKYLKLNLPDVTSFLLAGIIIGPFVLGRIGIKGLGFPSFEDVEGLELLSQCALGFIAFAIGNEFNLQQLKHVGKQAFVIGVVQGLVAAILVDAALIALHFAMPNVLSIPVALTLGAIATATAPAATIMVIRQYKAKGELTDILLPVVALDDAVGLAVFSISFGVAQSLVSGHTDMLSIVVEPLLEIVLSLGLGALVGVILTYIEKLFFSNSNRLSLSIAFVILTVALSMVKFNIGPVHVGFSTLLVCMMLGTIFCNICPLSNDIMSRTDSWTAPLFALFFVISGAELDLSVLANAKVILIGVVYIIVRSIGKYVGSYYSSKAVGCSKNVQKYLGITLLPQAGVALGMCVTASSLGTTEGTLIRNIVLFGVLIYELFGPLLTRWALMQSGDVSPIPHEVKTRRERRLLEVGHVNHFKVNREQKKKKN